MRTLRPRVVSPRRRRDVSHISETTIAASIPSPPDHLTETAAPNAIPAAYRHGRHRGEGTSAASASSSGPAGGPRGVRRSIHRRSSTRQRKPATIQSWRWMSSSAWRESTTLRCSRAISSPATKVQSGRPKSSWAISATPVTASVPATAEPIRHPNGLIPNALIPSAIVHLPSGGWTNEPTSHSCSRNRRSFGESILQRSIGAADEDARRLRVVVLVEHERRRARQTPQPDHGRDRRDGEDRHPGTVQPLQER